MQVFRVRDEDLASRRRNARSAVAIISGTVIGVVALSVGLRRWARIALAITATSAVPKTYRSLRRMTKGVVGKTDVVELLRTLPDGYFLLSDIALPGHPDNIDHIVVGPCGIVVIETKNFSSSVGSHGNPRFVNGRSSHSIGKQANHGAIAIREILTRVHPDLEHSVLRCVDSIAVFKNRPDRVRVHGPETIVARYSQLLDVILAIARRKRVPSSAAAKLAVSLVTMSLNGFGTGAPDGPVARMANGSELRGRAGLIVDAGRDRLS